MKKHQRFLLFSLAFLCMFCTPFLASAVDLTSYTNGVSGDATADYEARLARYTVIMGRGSGDTSDTIYPDGYASQGIYELASYGGSGVAWYMCDGVVGNSFNTFDFGTRIAELFPDTPETLAGEDFFGYKFKMATNVESIFFANRIYRDGGTFDTAPRVEIFSGGAWQEVGVTWTTEEGTSTTYNDAYRAFHLEGTTRVYDEPSNRIYNINLNETATEVWGVRLIGVPKAIEGVSVADANGFIGTTEMQVEGTSPITQQIDLTTNLALNQIPIWTTDGTNMPALPEGETYDFLHTQNSAPERLCDGNVATYDTTFSREDVVEGVRIPNLLYYDEMGAPVNKEFAGVMFNVDEEPTGVAAIGIVQRMFGDGGFLTAESTEVQYTTDEGATWTPVTGLDIGRYDDDYDALEAITWSNYHSMLFTFDTIDEEIDGIRVFGTPEYGTENVGDGNGFFGVAEFEVFAAVPEPSTLTLLLGLCSLALLRRVRRS